MAKSPTQRTIEVLDRSKIAWDFGEKWNAFSRTSKDLFGFIDLVALRPGVIIGIQCTTGANHAARRTKIIHECTYNAWHWLNSGGEIEIWSWSQRKIEGRKQWAERIEAISKQDLLSRWDGEKNPYARLVQMLEEMENGGPRGKTSGRASEPAK